MQYAVMRVFFEKGGARMIQSVSPRGRICPCTRPGRQP